MHHSDNKAAIQSIVEEFKAVNDYDERLDKVYCPALKEILEYVIKHEKEHIAMLMKWLVERDYDLAKEMNDEASQN